MTVWLQGFQRLHADTEVATQLRVRHEPWNVAGAEAQRSSISSGSMFAPRSATILLPNSVAQDRISRDRGLRTSAQSPTRQAFEAQTCTVTYDVNRISRPVPSTARPPIRGLISLANLASFRPPIWPLLPFCYRTVFTPLALAFAGSRRQPVPRRWHPCRA